MSDGLLRLEPATIARLRPAPAERPLVHIQGDTLCALPGESLLETLERHGHRLEFQCRSGYCGACRTPLLAGLVHYPSPPLAFVSSGECLPCCCRPVGAIRLSPARIENTEA